MALDVEKKMAEGDDKDRQTVDRGLGSGRTLRWVIFLGKRFIRSIINITITQANDSCVAGALRRLQAHKAEYRSQEGDVSCSQAVSDSLVGGRGRGERHWIAKK